MSRLSYLSLRLSSMLPHFAIPQQHNQRFGPKQLLRFVSPQPLPPAGAVSATHGRHQQLGSLPFLRRNRAILSALSGHERQYAISAGFAALSVILPDPVTGTTGVE